MTRNRFAIADGQYRGQLISDLLRLTAMKNPFELLISEWEERKVLDKVHYYG